jgi:2-succinyl-6-hydroxy-2,4-cyclohexadiene-1-carboxylate synthase
LIHPPGLWESATRGRGPPLLLLHGFGWTHRSFDDLVPGIEAGHQLILADLPGHGASVAPTDGFERSLAALASELGARDAGPLPVIGYSMGARLALGLAVGWPALVSRLVLISGSPGLESEAARVARRRADEALASDLEQLGVERFLDRWEAGPLFARLRALPVERQAELRAHRTKDAAGMAVALRHLGLGAQPSYWGRLGELSIPVLLMTGAEDPKFTELARTMSGRIVQAETLSLAGCGHAPHLESPGQVVGPLRSFLSGSSQALR